MKIGILGTGPVGQALGNAFITLGHQVKMGSRQVGNEKAVEWVKKTGKDASQGTFAEAAGFGELILLCTLGSANLEVIKLAGPERLRGKILIDTTNPLDLSKGMPPGLFVGHTDSGGEQVQRAAPEARVVKAFNTVGNALMFKPNLPGGPPDMFVCGNDDKAKSAVAEILQQFGWGIVDLGGIEASRFTEPMCLVWVMHGIRSGGWTHAFKLLRA